MTRWVDKPDETEDQDDRVGVYFGRDIKGRRDDRVPCTKRARTPPHQRDFSGFSFNDYIPGNSGGDGDDRETQSSLGGVVPSNSFNVPSNSAGGGGETQPSLGLRKESCLSDILAQHGGRGVSRRCHWEIQKLRQENRCMYALPGQGCNRDEEKARIRDILAGNGGGSGKVGMQALGGEKACIILDDSEEEGEVQFLGEALPFQLQASPFQPRTPKPVTTTFSQAELQTPSPFSSSQKRKLDSIDTTTTPQRLAPQQRQVTSAQSLSRSEWTFGERRPTAVSEGAAVEALSPFSTPTNRRDSMSGSINRREGYEIVPIPANAREMSVGNGSEAVTSANKRQVSILGNRGGGKFSVGSDVLSAFKEGLTPTSKIKDGGKLSAGGEVVGAAKEQIPSTPTSKSKNGGKLGQGSEVVTAAKYQSIQTPKPKNRGVSQDWEVIEVGQSTNLTLPHRSSTQRKPVIDLEDYEVLPPLTGTTSNTTTSKATIINDSDSEGDFDFEIISSNTLTSPTLARRRSTIYPMRNPPIIHPLDIVWATMVNNFALERNIVVELSDGDFLKITNLVRNVDTYDLTLRGHRFQRTRDLNGLLAKKRNELCWVTEVDEDDDRPASVQSLAEVPASSVVRVRKTLITNMSFPAATYRNTPFPGGMENVEHEGIVAVRWSYTTTWPSAKARINNENAFCERVLRHLGEGDALVGEGLRIRDGFAREQFRGPTVVGGSYIPVVRKGGKMGVSNTKSPVRGNETGWLRRLTGSRSNSVQDLSGQTIGLFDDDMVDLTDEFPKTPTKSRLSVAETTQRMLGQIDLTTPELSFPPSDGTVRATNASSKVKATIKRVEGQMYTYGDAFCGAGGATRGAHMAGFKVVWGFDFNAHACETWRLNFPSANMYEMSAYDVCEIWAKEAKAGMPNRAQVDILHISPPCQFFSPAHTIPGKDDDMNTASLLACGRLLALVKPRVVTLEQTFGIGHAEFTRWFNALIHQFTDNGYSLRWKICHLQDWGLPQRRQRLIIIAACPGETLPPFPPYTHSKHPTPLNGLKPYTSVNTLLTSIPLNAPDHDLASSLSKPLHESPWDGTSIAPRAITTHGGQNYHPSGTRGFTNRELAALQGFPGGHRFGEKNVKKQIGNAVPPSVAGVLFGAVRKALEAADGVEMEVIDVGGGVEREVFVVD
ncbi:hypothetical protein VF21_01623 [Pseudogymnoascus sp. 05NY08]|nr:hypothetical protein VF21_01623 [Pseudogymnoascus sp. 05NY08]